MHGRARESYKHTLKDPKAFENYKKKVRVRAPSLAPPAAPSRRAGGDRSLCSRR
jgi:hypothetical protein